MKTKIDLISTALLLFAVILIGYVFSPGHTNRDTIEMLVQARSGVFNDWHSPLVSGTWSLFGGGAWLLPATLYITLALFAFFTYYLFRQAGVQHAKACLLTGLLCITPPVLGCLGTVCKDTWVATLFLGILALSVLSHPQSRFYLVGLRNLAFAIASLIRPEFILIAAFFLLLEGLFFAAFLRMVINGFTVLALFFVIGFIVEKIEHTAHNHPVQQLYLNDLAYLSLAENKLLIPEPFLGGNDLAIIRKHYRDPSLDDNLFGEPKNEMLKYSTDAAAADDLRSRWFDAVMHNPMACLKHRFKILEAYFWIGSYFQEGIDDNDFGLHINHEAANRMVISYLAAFNRTPVQRHFLSFYGSLILIFILYRSPVRTVFDKYLIIALTCGCFYQLLVGIMGMNPAWRYGYAAVVLFWLAVYLVALRAITRFREDRRPGMDQT